MITSQYLLQFIEIGLFCVFLFIVLMHMEIKIRKTRFLSETLEKTWWPTKRIYVDEENSGKNLFGGKKWFIDPIESKKIYYDRVSCFKNGHIAPAHVETVLDVRTGKIQETRTAYISCKGFQKKSKRGF